MHPCTCVSKGDSFSRGMTGSERGLSRSRRQHATNGVLHSHKRHVPALLAGKQHFLARFARSKRSSLANGACLRQLLADGALPATCSPVARSESLGLMSVGLSFRAPPLFTRRVLRSQRVHWSSERKESCARLFFHSQCVGLLITHVCGMCVVCGVCGVCGECGHFLPSCRKT